MADAVVTRQPAVPQWVGSLYRCNRELDAFPDQVKETRLSDS